MVNLAPTDCTKPISIWWHNLISVNYSKEQVGRDGDEKVDLGGFGRTVGRKVKITKIYFINSKT